MVKRGGTVVIAAIAPVEEAREQARALVQAHDRFGLAHLPTPLEVREARDVERLHVDLGRVTSAACRATS